MAVQARGGGSSRGGCSQGGLHPNWWCFCLHERGRDWRNAAEVLQGGSDQAGGPLLHFKAMVANYYIVVNYFFNILSLFNNNIIIKGMSIMIQKMSSHVFKRVSRICSLIIWTSTLSTHLLPWRKAPVKDSLILKRMTSWAMTLITWPRPGKWVHQLH